MEVSYAPAACSASKNACDRCQNAVCEGFDAKHMVIAYKLSIEDLLMNKTGVIEFYEMSIECM